LLCLAQPTSVILGNQGVLGVLCRVAGRLVGRRAAGLLPGCVRAGGGPVTAGARCGGAGGILGRPRAGDAAACTADYGSFPPDCRGRLGDGSTHE
jgi:hypothetical protein